MSAILKYLCCGYGFAIANIYTQTVFKNFMNEVAKQNFNAAD